MDPKYHYRRMLPHHQWRGKVYFITFCTCDRHELIAGSRDIVLETCHAGNGKLFHLHAIVVMPDHVHLAITPTCNEDGEVLLPKILQAIKGASAHRINKYLGPRGRVWQDESFDRALRSTANLRGKIEYMLVIRLELGSSRIPATIDGSGQNRGRGRPLPHNLRISNA